MIEAGLALALSTGAFVGGLAVSTVTVVGLCVAVGCCMEFAARQLERYE